MYATIVTLANSVSKARENVCPSSVLEIPCRKPLPPRLVTAVLALKVNSDKAMRVLANRCNALEEPSQIRIQSRLPTVSVAQLERFRWGDPINAKTLHVHEEVLPWRMLGMPRPVASPVMLDMSRWEVRNRPASYVPVEHLRKLKTRLMQGHQPALLLRVHRVFIVHLVQRIQQPIVYPVTLALIPLERMAIVNQWNVPWVQNLI